MTENINVMNRITENGIPLLTINTGIMLCLVWLDAQKYYISIFNALGKEDQYIVVNKNPIFTNTIKSEKKFFQNFFVYFFSNYIGVLNKNVLLVNNKTELTLGKVVKQEIVNRNHVQNLFNNISSIKKIDSLIKKELNVDLENYDFSMIKNHPDSKSNSHKDLHNKYFSVLNKKDIKLNVIEEKWKKGDILEKLENLLGNHHFNTGDCAGNELLFYFGFHKCSIGTKIAILIIHLDICTEIKQVYNIIEKCSCFSENKN